MIQKEPDTSENANYLGKPSTELRLDTENYHQSSAVRNDKLKILFIYVPMLQLKQLI